MGSSVAAVVVPAILATNAAVQEVFETQAGLAAELERLTALLERFNAEQGEAPRLTDRLEQLGDARDRMGRINVMLAKIQARLERLYADFGHGEPTTPPANK